MAVHIITDSASDITQAEAAEWGISLTPLTTVFSDTSYRDGIDITSEEFFEKLIESDDLPTTSQVTPGAYMELYDAAQAKGDEVLCITLSSELSGCYQSALIAQASYGDSVVVVDSLNATLGQKILVRRAIELRDQGLSAQEIADIIEVEKTRIKLIALVDTLEYLCKGGRLSKTAAIAGTLLSIKPVIAVEEGKVVVLGKARGSKNGANYLNKLVGEAGINFDMPFSLAFSGLSDAMLRKYAKDSAHLYEGRSLEDLPVCKIGSTIGTHVGPGAIAVAYFEK